MRISLPPYCLTLGVTLSAVPSRPTPSFADTAASPISLAPQEFGTAAPASMPETPFPARGIYLWSYPWAVKNGDFDKALNVAGVDGVGVHVDWSEISPALKTYDFGSVDRQIAAARAHHLPVELAIAAGKGIPNWLFAPPPLGMGLRRLDFKITYHGGIEPCHDVSMPPPWDQGYQDAFADMLAQLSHHLKST